MVPVSVSGLQVRLLAWLSTLHATHGEPVCEMAMTATAVRNAEPGRRHVKLINDCGRNSYQASSMMMGEQQAAGRKMPVLYYTIVYHTYILYLIDKHMIYCTSYTITYKYWPRNLPGAGESEQDAVSVSSSVPLQYAREVHRPTEGVRQKGFQEHVAFKALKSGSNVTFG